MLAGTQEFRPPPPAAVLFDRDGTLITDVPYNPDPAKVRPVPGARRLLDALRAAGVPVGIVSNQSGVGRGLITDEQLAAVNAGLEHLLGPFDSVLCCPHVPEDGCPCRKPAPGLVLRSCERLRVLPRRTVVVGDIGADLEAAVRAGARGILVPTPLTRRQEVAAAGEVAKDLDAVGDLLGLTTTWASGPSGARA